MTNLTEVIKSRKRVETWLAISTFVDLSAVSEISKKTWHKLELFIYLQIKTNLQRDLR